jgi:tetratricopeptide (TPR) repeat protein
MEPLIQGPSPVPGTRWQYARAANNLGIALLGVQREKSRRLMNTARDLLQTLSAEFPDVPEYPQELASVHYNLGLLSQVEGRLDEALAAYKEDAALLETLRSRFPENPVLRQKLALALIGQNEVLANTSAVEAEASLRKALDEETAVVAKFPNVPEYQSNLGRGHCQLAGILMRRGRPDDASAEAEAALKIHKAVQHLAPGTASIEHYVWEDLAVLTSALISSQRLADAAKTAQEFVTITPAEEKAVLNAAGLLVRCSIEAARTSEGKAPSEQLQSQAVKMLSEAVRANVLKTGAPLEGPVFNPLRGRDDFENLMRSLTQAPRHG